LSLDTTASDAATEPHLPPPVQAPAERFVHAVTTAFGQRLVGLLAYGSAVAGGFRPGASDLNLLVVLERIEPADLELLGKLAAAGRKVRLTPVAVTPADLTATAATAPAVLWDMRDRSALLAGTHPLAELELCEADLARQLRFELRDKLFRLRAEYLATVGNRRAQEQLAAASFGSVLHLLRNLLRLAGKPADHEPLTTLGEASRAFGLELRTLQSLYLVRFGDKRLEPAAAAGLFRSYLALLEAAAAKADELAAGLEELPAAEPTAVAPEPAATAPDSEMAALAAFMARLNDGVPASSGSAVSDDSDAAPELEPQVAAAGDDEAQA
jgi:predicted nucleotidyltransferase